MSDRRVYRLPIFVDHLDTREFNQDYTVDHIKDIEEVKRWYQSFGIEIIDIDHIYPPIGPIRDEILAYYPEGWSEEGAGGPWVSVYNEKHEEMFHMFVKKAPWDYCFFARKA